MCGIAGSTQPKKISIHDTLMKLRHRGPDDQSHYQDDFIVLMHTRLAIQDIHGGQQPFHDQDHVIIFNGEIYNQHELRKNWPASFFKTSSDTEILLHLYLKFGHQMYAMIDGMFAFCIYDKKNRRLVLARDRTGKKPLYYTKTRNGFFFASELNALALMQPLNIDPHAVKCYLRAGFIYNHYTIYENVYTLGAGCELVYDLEAEKLSIQPYFNMLDYYQDEKHACSLDDAVTMVEANLIKSIKHRIDTSDREVGAFLSSGIDSNLITAIAASMKPGLRTFTVKSSGAFDESAYAALAAKKYQTQHTELTIDAHLSQDIEKILCGYGQPFMDSSAIPSYYVSRAARAHVAVILNGDGADELFGGYRRYVASSHAIFHLVRRIAWCRKYLRHPRKKQSYYSYLYRLLAMSGKKGIDYYLSSTTDLLEDIYEMKSLILQDMSHFINDVYQYSGLSRLSQSLYLDSQLLLFSDLLVKMDIATMSHALESRSPFLSKYMLELVPRIPDRYKIHRTKTKVVLRKLAEKYLPAALIHLPKRGFEVPLVEWVRHTLREPIQDMLTNGSFVESFIDKKFIQQMLENKLSLADEKRARIIWNWFCLEVWHRNRTQLTMRS